MKKVSEAQIDLKIDITNDILKKKKSLQFNQNIYLEKKKQELSPFALIKHRIEEMNRKLFEKRNQRK